MRVRSTASKPGITLAQKTTEKSDRPLQTWLVSPPGIMPLNDLRFDPTHGAEGTIYISNNGYGVPDRSLIVVDVKSGKMVEHFHNAPEVSPTPGFMTYVEGVPHSSMDKPATMPGGGVNGIELSPDNKTLYWTTPTNPDYYSIPTAG